MSRIIEVITADNDHRPISGTDDGAVNVNIVGGENIEVSATVDAVTIENTAENAVPVTVGGSVDVEIGNTSANPVPVAVQSTPVATSAVDLSGTTSGAAMDEVTTINFGGTSKSIYVKNEDAAETIDVSFDGSTWFALEPGVSIDMDVSRTSIRVKCDTALGVEYTCLVRI